ncbi:transcriptional regulator [Halogeometricum sp. S1BR25-6]|uniref:Transcriptional regulator n=1 Tax=Halogeometricum salsisoli TaxID=2950536 RepID=A0ABU2GIY9_9EURY|nr:transcriptional regulator [Halogeometricum sp. S1BR25-6]MDS0300381.1 transcriptional regulator [Halogeometricum sp. S1BR25-6]
MDDNATHNAENRPPRETGPTDRPPRLTAEIVLPRGGPAECTLFPPDLVGFERTTTWITAEEGSFVSLAKMA